MHIRNVFLHYYQSQYVCYEEQERLQEVIQLQRMCQPEVNKQIKF